MAKLPEPPSPLSIPPEPRRFRAGTRLCRIYTRGGRFPSRWSDLRSHGPPRLQSKGILYAAADATTCLAEVFQGTRMVDRRAGDPWLVVFELARDLGPLGASIELPIRDDMLDRGRDARGEAIMFGRVLMGEMGR